MAKRTTTQPEAAKKTVKAGETATNAVTTGTKRAGTKTARGAKPIDKPRCGLCGNTKNLTKTICCNQWICDDEANYVTFSFARNSCHRNHDRYTLCSFHYNEEHKGKWQDCAACRKDFETEIYVWYGTNEYNFEKLENPPSFEPTKCSSCGTVINLGEDGYSMLGDAYTCESCSARKFREM